MAHLVSACFEHKAQVPSPALRKPGCGGASLLLYSEFEDILGSMRPSLEKVLVADTTCVKTWGGGGEAILKFLTEHI